MYCITDRSRCRGNQTSVEIYEIKYLNTFLNLWLGICVLKKRRPETVLNIKGTNLAHT